MKQNSSVPGELLLEQRLVLLWVEDGAVLLVLVVGAVADVVVGGAAAVLAGVGPRLDVHVHHVGAEGRLDDEALAALLAPGNLEKCVGELTSI